MPDHLRPRRLDQLLEMELHAPADLLALVLETPALLHHVHLQLHIVIAGGPFESISLELLKLHAAIISHCQKAVHVQDSLMP